MAVAAYYSWVKLGKPLVPATPIRELVEKLRVAFPRAAAVNLFSWYANDAHYQNDYPQDHTPFSVTGWPAESPQWWVFATDIMHRPDLGVDCDKLFPYWLAEAKAGRMPWLKYMIYKRTVYDVRYGWRPQPSSGHDKHIHLSARTDHQRTHLGDWSVNGDDMPTVQEIKDAILGDGGIQALLYRVEALVSNRETVAKVGGANVLAQRVNALAVEVVALRTAVEGIVGGDPDSAAILQGVDERLAAFRAQVEADTRDAVADLAEGGAEAVRADA